MTPGCPKPLNEAFPGGATYTELGVWERGGGGRCYGVRAPFQHCGDGYRDERPLGSTWPGDCHASGIPHGLTGRELGPGVPVFDLETGDCVAGDLDAVVLSRVVVVSCTAPHDGLVIAAEEAPVQSTGRPASQPVLHALADVTCDRAFRATYSTSPETSDLGVHLLWPTEASQMVDGANQITCIADRDDGSSLPGR